MKKFISYCVEHPVWTFAVLLFLNGIDLSITIFVIQGDWFLEYNPLMASAYWLSPRTFALIKIFLVALGGSMLFYGARVPSRFERYVKLALPILSLVYLGVVVSHILRLFIGIE